MTAYEHADRSQQMAVFTHFSKMSILDCNKENQQPKAKSYWENYRFGRNIFLNFDCKNGKQPWHRQTPSSFYYSEGEEHFFPYTRMCKTHWFRTKLSAEDKNICSVLLPQSKQRATGSAPSLWVIADNVCSWQYHHYKLYYCFWYFTRWLAGSSLSHVFHGYLLDSSITQPVNASGMYKHC